VSNPPPSDYETDAPRRTGRLQTDLAPLTLDGSSIQTDQDGYRPIVWIIIGMIKAHPMKNRMAR
jgi:hypothetical protein